MRFKPVEDPKDLLSATQVAALLPDTTTQTVLRWAKQGQLPFVELPGGRSSRKYFRRSDIEALLTPRVAPAAESSLSPSAPSTSASAGSVSGGGVR